MADEMAEKIEKPNNDSKKSKKNMFKWMAIMIIAAILIFGSVIGFNLFKQYEIQKYMENFPVQKFPVTSLKLEPETWYPKIKSIGLIEPNQGVQLAAEEPGKVVELNFDSGYQIKKGDILVKQDQSVEIANLEQAKAEMIFTKSSYERMARLIKTGAISQEQYDKSLSNYQALQNQILSLQATINRLNISAPFSGIAGIRNVYLGQYLNSGDTITHLEDLSIMKIRFTVPQTDFKKIYVGQDVEITVDAYPKTKFHGKITAIDSAVNPKSGVFQAQASIPNSDRKLRSGMFAQISISLPKEENQIVIPITAINFALYGQSVYIIEDSKNKSGQPTKKVKQVVVTVGDRQGDKAKISSGLKANENIVTSGQVRLSNGSEVKIVKSDTLNPPKELPRL